MMPLLQERDKFLADLAPEIPGERGIRCAGEGAHLDRVLARLSNLQDIDLTVRERRRAENPRELLTERLNGRLVVDVDRDRRQHLRGRPSPVLKRMLDEIGDRP